MNKIKKIGLIVEDNSDYESFRIIINRIVNNKKLSFAKFVGSGCGKIKRKAQAYCRILEKRGCDLLILVHDLDRNNYDELERDLKSKFITLKPHFICIPKEEIEAWFLSDPDAIKKCLNLKRKPLIKGNPENISSPKEYLLNQVKSCSNNEKIYLHTKHNEQLSREVSIDLIKNQCNSFEKFYNFICSQKF